LGSLSVEYGVFTKPWKEMPLAELGEFVAGMGFQGVEFPVRPGYQVEPDKVADLPKAAKTLGEFGVSIMSVAGPTDEATISACGEAGVPIIRVCESIGDDGYLATEKRLQRQYDEMVPLLDKHGVTLGVQNHCGNNIASAAGLRRLIEKYDPKHVAAVWDPAHTALDGEQPHLALDLVWSHLCMVNLKNAYWRRTTGPEAEYAEWQWYWTSGRHGLAPWPRVIELLRERDYKGPLCLCAEYSDHDAVTRLIVEDISFAKSLVG